MPKVHGRPALEVKELHISQGTLLSYLIRGLLSAALEKSGAQVRWQLTPRPDRFE